MKRTFADDAQTFLSALHHVDTTPQTRAVLINVQAEIAQTLCRCPVVLRSWTELPPDLVLMIFLTERSGARLCRRFFQIYIERKVRRLRIPGALTTALDLASLPLYPDAVPVDIVMPVSKYGWSPMCLIMFLTTRQLLHRITDVTPLYGACDFNKTTFLEIRGLNSHIRATANVVFFSLSHTWYGVTHFIWKVTTIRLNQFYALVFRRFPDLQHLRIEITEDPRRLRAFKHLANHLASIDNAQPTLRTIELPKDLYDRLFPHLNVYILHKIVTY